MALSRKTTVNLFLALLFSVCLVGCGGGGESPSGQSPSGPVLSWNPPQSFSDQTPLDPAKDLEDYEVYIKETGSFQSTEPPTAIVSAVDPSTGNLVRSFNLGNLGPFLSANKTYYVSMRSVSKTGVKSAFSPSVSFSI